MNTLNIISIIVPSLIGLLPFILRFNKINKSRQKYELLRKQIDFMSLYDKEYINSLIIEQYKCLMFFDFTGIYLSSSKQKILTDLYKKFEPDFNWKFYKYAFPFMKFENDTISIQLEKSELFFTFYFLISALILIADAVFLFYFYSSFIVLIFGIIFFIAGYILFIWAILQFNNYKRLKKFILFNKKS
mgnify:CR=1 FL=1